MRPGLCFKTLLLAIAVAAVAAFIALFLALRSPALQELLTVPRGHRAAARGDVDEIGRLVSSNAIDPNARASFPWNRERDGASPLLLAAESGSAESVELLMSAGGNAEYRDDLARTLLHYAARSDRTEMIVLCLRLHPAIDDVDYEGCTALQLATRSGKLSGTVALIGAGASLDIVTSDNRNLLHDIHDNAASLVGSIVQSGVNVDCKSLLLSETPLIAAVKRGSLAVATSLVVAGANVDLVDTQGKSAMDYANELGQQPIVEMLKRSRVIQERLTK